MKNRHHQNGFTLIEILVATTIILSILSMVYGTYFTISKSTQATNARTILFQQGREALDKLSRQIRCSYVDTISDSTHTVGLFSKQKKKVSQNSPDYFSCKPNNPTGEVLHLITANRFGRAGNSSNGLFEVTYKFDKSKGLLYLSQEKFVDIAKNAAKKRTWQPIAENIESLEFAFFDGRQWRNDWSFKDRKKLPDAVKIDITFQDKNSRTYEYGTVAYVSCNRNQGRQTQSAKLEIAKK